MHNIDFIKSFICPHCQHPSNLPSLPQEEFSIVNTFCLCKKTSVSLHAHTNYYVLYLNLINHLQIQIHVEDNNLTIFQFVEYPPNDQIMSVAGALHLVLDYIPKHLNWSDINQLIKQLEIMVTFQ